MTDPTEDDLSRFIRETEERDPTFKAARADAAVRFDLPDQLRERRREMGLSQTDIATRLQIKQPTVSEFEAGVGDFYLSTVQAYARALGGRINITFVPRRDEGEGPQDPDADHPDYRQEWRP